MLHAPDTAIMEREPAPLHITPHMPEVDYQPLNILLVEDVRSDARLTEIVLTAANVPHALTRLGRGDEVLPHLLLNHWYSASSKLDLIILDLGLPGMDGFDILTEMSQMPAMMRSIPIVVLTGHKDFEYISTAYPLYIINYINKPCNYEDIRNVLRRVRKEKDGLRALSK